MKLLITGGNGFVGRNFVNKCKDIMHLAPTKYELNLLKFDNLVEYIREKRPDTILHMAATCGSIVYNSKNPAMFLYENTQMALNIYEAARKCEIFNVYALGSSCSYPKFCPVPSKEDDIWNGAPEITNFPYGQAKRTLLMLGQTYREQYGIKGCTFIPANMYGKYDCFEDYKSHVIPAMIKRFIHARNQRHPSVTFLGTGNAQRDFLFVEDAVNAIKFAIDTKLDSPLPINLGSGNSIRIEYLAHLIKDFTDYKGDIFFANDNFDGQPHKFLDITRAKHILDWSPTTSLKEGLEKTIKWYEDCKDIWPG